MMNRCIKSKRKPSGMKIGGNGSLLLLSLKQKKCNFQNLTMQMSLSKKSKKIMKFISVGWI